MSDVQYGEVKIDGDEASLIFKRKLNHTPERVWNALTNQDELREWFMAESSIEGVKGGKIDMVTGPSRFHWNGTILTWEPFIILEYQAAIAPHEHLPGGEENVVVRWQLEEVAGGTLLTLVYRRLSRGTALGFAPGMHAFLDRLEAQLGNQPLPNWMQRYGAVSAGYPSWTSS